MKSRTKKLKDLSKKRLPRCHKSIKFIATLDPYKLKERLGSYTLIQEPKLHKFIKHINFNLKYTDCYYLIQSLNKKLYIAGILDTTIYLFKDMRHLFYHNQEGINHVSESFPKSKEDREKVKDCISRYIRHREDNECPCLSEWYLQTEQTDSGC